MKLMIGSIQISALLYNGGTSSYQSFLGFDKEHKTVVVVLSNYSAKDGTEDEDALDIIGYSLLDSLSKNEGIFNF